MPPLTDPPHRGAVLVYAGNSTGRHCRIKHNVRLHLRAWARISAAVLPNRIGQHGSLDLHELRLGQARGPAQLRGVNTAAHRMHRTFCSAALSNEPTPPRDLQGLSRECCNPAALTLASAWQFVARNRWASSAAAVYAGQLCAAHGHANPFLALPIGLELAGICSVLGGRTQREKSHRQAW